MLAALPLVLVACATTGGPGPFGEVGDELGTRLVDRARDELGHRGGFTVSDERFPADCSGFVSAVYQAEGIPLRRLGARAAPAERSGVAALYRAATIWGVVFGGGGEWPRPGDLVFFRGTYDRERDGRFDSPFTHVGIVEAVDESGTVTFIHRGHHGVARAVLTADRPTEVRDAGGRALNSPLRVVRRGAARALAGELFMGYGRIDPRRIPGDVAMR
jgi:probable lipoprotein NlpC